MELPSSSDALSRFALTSHQTALCLIPPRHLWSSVNRVRSLYDKAYATWPPHINLIYPFVGPEVLSDAANILENLQLPIDAQHHVELCDVGTFNHKHSNTVFLKPTPSSSTVFSNLRSHVCHSLGQPEKPHDTAFQPHLTVGQTDDSSSDSHRFFVDKARHITPLAWQLGQVAILVRDASHTAAGSSMKLWGYLDIASSLVTRLSPLEYLVKESNDASTIVPQLSYRFAEETGSWETAAGPAAVQDSQSVLDRLVVASYNVLAEFQWPPKSDRHPGLVENLLLARSAADILVLEEVTDHFLPFLLADQGVRKRYPFVTHGPPSQPGVGPLPSLLNIVVLSVYPVEWHQLPFQRKHKSCTVVQFPTIGHFDSDGVFRPWVLAACHLSQGLTDGAVAAKKNEVQKILNHLSTRFEHNHWVLAGDFNLATSTYTIESAQKSQDISSQTVQYLRDIDRALTDVGFRDTWLTSRLESGESSDVGRGNHSVLDAFSGEQGATFDPFTNTLAAGLVGSGFNNRPQRYDRILVKSDGSYHPQGFNMFGQAMTERPGQDTPSFASDHWGIRCLLVRSSPAESTASRPSRTDIRLCKATNTASLGDLDCCLESRGYFPTHDERELRASALEKLQLVLQDSSRTGTRTDNHAGPVLLLVPVGSYGLGVWNKESDVDCLCIGSISSKTFFALALQRLKRASSEDIQILRRVQAHSGYMLELEVQGIKMDLQYCTATSIAEQFPDVMKRPANDTAFALPFQVLAKLKPVRDLYYLRRSIPDMAQYRKAHLFIKAWAKARGVYSARFGYLGGIHISVLLVPVCKTLALEAEMVSTADIIITFFKHYAGVDWKSELIFDPFFHKEVRYRRTFREPLCLLGWHAPSLNTAFNASVSTVNTVAAEFERTRSIINTSAFSWEDLLGSSSSGMSQLPGNPGASEFMQTYKSFIKIDVHYWGPSQEKSGRFIGWLESRCVNLLVDLDKKVKNVSTRIWPARFVNSAYRSANDTDGQEYHGCYLVGLERSGDEFSRDDNKATQTSLDAVLHEFESRISGDEKYYDGNSCWVSTSVVRSMDLGNLELDEEGWGKYTGDSDDDEDNDDVDGDDELDLDGLQIDQDGSHARKKEGTVVSRGSRAAAITKMPGLGKFRTAADVLNRLRWDVNLDMGDYIIGYEDRFTGARERAVEHWKSEQTDEEFIPQHRILYFKRRSDGVIMWERRSRTDDIFGSGVKPGIS